MSKWIFSPFLLILLMSCDSVTYHRIPDNKRPIFKTGDTVIFKTTGGLSDSTVVQLIEYQRSSDKVNEYEELVFNYFQMKSGVKEQEACMAIQQGVSGATLSSRGYYLSFDENPVQYTMHNGDIITTAHFTRNPVTALSDDIVDILYHANYGIVRYKYLDSEYYHLNLNK